MNGARDNKAPHVVIVLLNWNGLSDTVKCLDSLKKIQYANYRVVVVDNASKDNEAARLVQEYGNFIHVIRNSENYGFSGGSNTGIRYALDVCAANYVLLLNNDTVVAPDFIDRMVDAMETDANIGIAGAKTYYYDSNRIQFAWGKMNLWVGQPLYIPKYVAGKIKEAPVDKGQYNDVTEADWISGCCMLIRDKVVKDIGFLNDSYFAYFEDIEYCSRARKRGYSVVYIPGARIWHKSRGSASRTGSYAIYLNTRNRFWFMKENASRIQYMSFIIYFFVLYMWLAIIYHGIISASIINLKSFFNGIWDGLKGKQEHGFYTIPKE